LLPLIEGDFGSGEDSNEVRMVGVGGTSPKTKAAKVVWWILFGIFAVSVIYVLIENRHNF
jgi:hypothetical protein